MRTENFGNNILLYQCDNKKYYFDNDIDVLFLDPPFELYKEIYIPNFQTCIAFTNWQNRGYLTNKLGEPRIEMIWHFADGRWVSPNMPRITHESILIYGSTGSANVGIKNPLHGKKIKKGFGSIGRDKLGARTYEPKNRKQLNSVLFFPRNVNSYLGCWSKPVELIYTLFEFAGDRNIVDPFMGSGSSAIASIKLNRKFVGIEKDLATFDIACKRIDEFLSQGDLFREII
tara:strand:- start:588 stop:1277 length:690 start_codon:yes stop_codon:yes gene_type:complete